MSHSHSFVSNRPWEESLWLLSSPPPRPWRLTGRALFLWCLRSAAPLTCNRQMMPVNGRWMAGEWLSWCIHQLPEWIQWLSWCMVMRIGVCVLIPCLLWNIGVDPIKAAKPCLQCQPAQAYGIATRSSQNPKYHRPCQDKGGIQHVRNRWLMDAYGGLVICSKFCAGYNRTKNPTAEFGKDFNDHSRPIFSISMQKH